MKSIFNELISYLKDKKLTIATAESLTGGMLASSLVDIPGASKSFKEGFVTYCDEAKIRSLDVPAETIQKHGSISSETAYAMAEGATKKSGCDIALATTGNAGPDCDEGKEAGLVYIGINICGNIKTFEFHFKGDRESVRKQSAVAAAELCLKLLKA